MAIGIETACAFTGHRPKHFHYGYDEEHPDCLALKDALGKRITELAGQGIETFYTGMALGVDIWAAEVVQLLQLTAAYKHLRLIPVRPCDSQADRWTPEQRERYHLILERAEPAILISDKYTPGCMWERNKYMVDHARNLVAVYNGNPKTGTGQTVRYAQRQDRIMYTLNPEDFKGTMSARGIEAEENRRNFIVK